MWLLAMSQRQRSEVSTPRHNNLSGKNNSLMLQLYIVWDDSELERGLLFGFLCSAAPSLWNGGISSCVGIFRSLCEFKRALHNATQCGGPRVCNTHARV